MFDHPHGKEIFPNVWSELPWCGFVLFPGILSGSQRKDGGEVMRNEYSLTEENVFKKGDFSVCFMTNNEGLYL